MLRVSFSQLNMFEKCSRSWYYSYIKKIYVKSDMCYADAGTVVHKTLDAFQQNKQIPLDDLKQIFEQQWKHFKLDESMIAKKKDEYWMMVLNGKELNIDTTSTEFRILTNDTVAYLDGLNTNDDFIIDWKTSTRSMENEEEYRKQLEYYSWLYYEKFGRVPKNAYVVYLKYLGDKQKLEIFPTADTITNTIAWHNRLTQQMIQYMADKKDPPKCESCFHFCAYKDICNNTGNETIKFTLAHVGNYIFINETVEPLLNKGLKKKFSYELPNAHYIKKHSPMANTTICFWNEKKRMIPMAFEHGLKKTLADYAVHTERKLIIEDKECRLFNDIRLMELPVQLRDRELRSYQTDAVRDFMHKKIGIVECGTGGGKTTIAAEIIRSLGFKTLFIVNKIELLNQAKGVFEKALGVPIGIIGAGEDDIQHITVATIQTLTKHIDKYANYLKSVRLLIVDECHNAGAKSYIKLARYLTATEYRLGLTGTAFRTDKTDMVMNAVVGYKIFELPASKLIDDGYLFKPQIIFHSNYMTDDEIEDMERDCKDGLINEMDKYIDAYKVFIADNHLRNKLIKDIVDKNEGKRILILTKLVDHGKELAEFVGGYHLYGDTNLDDRKQLLEDFKNDKIKVLVMTLTIAQEGLDLPFLEIIINAAANKADIASIQSLGRLLRLCEGKQQAVYHDFVDGHRFFRLASYARKRAFYKQGHDVEVEQY